MTHAIGNPRSASLKKCAHRAVERLIGRAAIEIHQVCQELVKQEIDQFKFELYTEMRALW